MAARNNGGRVDWATDSRYLLAKLTFLGYLGGGGITKNNYVMSDIKSVLNFLMYIIIN